MELDTILILAASMVLQIITALLALRLIAISGGRRAWVLISAALLLMAVRRFITLFHKVFVDPIHPVDEISELVALITSGLMLGGVAGVPSLFLSLKRSEAAVRESQIRYRAIVEDQTEMICRFLPDRTITFVNEACCRYFGRKREELLGAAFLPFTVNEDRRMCEEHICSLTRDSSCGVIEHRVRLQDGAIRWQQWTNRALFDEEDRLIEYQSAGRDVTDQKRLEEQLRQACVYNRSLIEVSLDPLVTIDHEGKITDVNHATELATGNTRAELIGTCFCDYFTEPEKARLGYLEVFEKGQAPLFDGSHLVLKEA